MDNVFYKSRQKNNEIWKNSIRLNPAGNVIVAAVDLPPEKKIIGESIVTVQNIPIGHKLATQVIPRGEAISK